MPDSAFKTPVLRTTKEAPDVFAGQEKDLPLFEEVSIHPFKRRERTSPARLRHSRCVSRSP